MRLLVVEDDPDLNRQLTTALTDAGYVVDRAFDGEEGHFLGDSEPYDAVVLDIGLPKMDGISVLEAWRRNGRAMPVLILTARDRWSDKVQGFDAGADDYVAKPFHLEEVLARIRALLRRSTGHAQSELTCGPVSLDTRTGRVSVSGNPIKMTSHEYRLLAYLMHHTGRVVSRTELVEHLYDQDFDRDSNTIEVFVGRIRKKLDVDIIQTVRGLGYLLTPPSPGNLMRLALLFEHDLIRRPVSIRRVGAWGHAFRDHALMRGSSLATRLFLSATAWVVVILVITGVVLSSVYRNATERAFDRRLNLYLRTLIAEVATPDEPPDHQFQSLGEPLFELPLSGWYWQIVRTDEKAETRASRSLWDKKLPKLEEHRRGTDRRPASVSAMSTGPRARACGWSSGRSISASTANSWSAWPATPSEIFDEIRSLRLLPRRHLRRARHRAAADHDLPGPLRAGAAQAHFGIDRRYPLRPRRTAGGRVSRRDRAAGARDQRADRRQPRDRRARAHPCRQSRPCHQDAALRHRQRGCRPRGRSLCQQGAGAGRCDARSGRASSGARAHRRARHHHRHRHRGRARHRGAAADHGKDPSGSRHHHRGRRPIRWPSFAASARTSRRWPAIWSTTPANGRPRRS